MFISKGVSILGFEFVSCTFELKHVHIHKVNFILLKE